MIREEKVCLNPVEVAIADRAEINMHSGSIQVAEEGIDYGQQAINLFMAKLRVGEIPIDAEWPNRIIRIPLVLGLTGDFDAARIALQAECGRINEEGGWLKRWLIGGSYGEAGDHLFADLLKADLKLGDDTSVASHGLDTNAELVLEALADFYGDEEVLGEHQGTSGFLAFTEQIKGTMPARGNISVYEESAHNQSALGLAIRCRNYSAAASAASMYEAESLQALGISKKAVLAGASNGEAMYNESLGTEWSPVLGTTDLTHIGVYDVWARVYTKSATLPWVRLIYDVGDWVAPEVNSQAPIPDGEGFYLVPLGQINITRMPIGEHRWQGVVQARGEVGGENIYVDRLHFFCADEVSGILKANSLYLDVPPEGPVVRDEFNQSAGNLKGKTLPIGGIWNQAGDPSEAIVEGGSAFREVLSDVAPGIIYTASGPTASTVVVEGSFYWNGVLPVEQLPTMGPVARFKDKDNFVCALINTKGFNSPEIYLWIRAVGIDTFTKPVKLPDILPFIDLVWVRLVLLPNSHYQIWAGRVNQVTLRTVGTEELIDAALPSGKVGFLNYQPSASGSNISEGEISAWTPLVDAVLFSGRSANLTWRGSFREVSSGSYFAPVSYPSSDTARIPVSGPEKRPVEFSFKPSRGDFGDVADSGLDNISAQVAYRPCWSDVPEFV